MQPNNDSSLLSFMDVTGSEADVSAMDDLQFMDALLDNDGTFGEEPGNLSIMASGGAAILPTTATMATPQYQVQPTQQLQQHQQSMVAGGMAQPARNQYQQPQTTMPQPAQGKPQAAIMPSPLTARLNYPFPTTAAGSKPKATFAAPVAAASRRKSKDAASTTSSRKRSRDVDVAPPVSEDESEQQRRRMDRNMREQQRSHKITDQIANLKELLAGANVHFKPDKYSTLISVVDYIRQLQTRSQMLDGEHKKLLDTISKTNEAVNSPYYSSSTGGDGGPMSNDLLSDPAGVALEDEHAVFVKDLDYQNVFMQCSLPLAVASIDGRFIACNAEFEALTGYERDELFPSESDDDPSTCQPRADTITSESGVPSTVNTSPKRNLSLFNLLGRTDMENVFLAMSRMLKQPMGAGTVDQTGPDTDTLNLQRDCWSGDVSQSRRNDAKVSF